MAARRAKTKPLRLGRTAAEVYALAWSIGQCQRLLDKEEALWESSLSKEPAHEDAEFWGEALADVQGLRRMFERLLVRDPATAVAEFNTARRTMLAGSAIGDEKREPARRAAAGRAVDHVYGWLLERAGKPIYWLPVPVSALDLIAVEHPVKNAADLEQLLAHAKVQRALKGNGAKKRGGQKEAAIALVALATGLDHQMVKRAAATIKTIKKVIPGHPK